MDEKFKTYIKERWMQGDFRRVRSIDDYCEDTEVYDETVEILDASKIQLIDDAIENCEIESVHIHHGNLCTMRIYMPDGWDLVSDSEYAWGMFLQFLKKNGIQYKHAERKDETKVPEVQ